MRINSFGLPDYVEAQHLPTKPRAFPASKTLTNTRIGRSKETYGLGPTLKKRDPVLSIGPVSEFFARYVLSSHCMASRLQRLE